MVTNQTIEDCFESSGLKYTGLDDGHWELKFRAPTSVFTLHVLNGLSNPALVQLLIFYMWAPKKHKAAVHKRLLEINADVGLAKFGTDDDGDILLESYVLRSQFTCAKLKAAIDGMLQAADRHYVDLRILERDGP